MQRPGGKDRPSPTESRKAGGSRKPYRPPTLTVHGSVKVLTRAKHGKRNDGGGKPRTKL